MHSKEPEPTASVPFWEGHVEVNPKKENGGLRAGESYFLGWCVRLLTTAPWKVSLEFCSTEIVEVYLARSRVEKELFEESNRLFDTWSNQWLNSGEGKREFRTKLEELRREWPKQRRRELVEHVKTVILPPRTVEQFRHDVIAERRKRLARLSLDPALCDFEYLNPPMTRGSQGIVNLAWAICWPFRERLRWNEVDWAGRVLQEAGYLSRVIQASGFNEGEVKEKINKLHGLTRLTPPERLESTAELRLFKWAVESFRRSLVGYLISNHGLRKCGHDYCQFGPYFFPKRASKKYCTIYCRNRQANIRYFRRKTKKEEKTK
jgi:hypothetical protein